MQHLFLILDAKMFKDFGGHIMWQDAEQHRLIAGIEVGENLRDVRRREAAENLTELVKIALADQFRQFGFKQAANHALTQPELAARRKTKSRSASHGTALLGLRGLIVSAQVSKDLPQPQLCLAFGFAILNPPPVSASLKSTTVPRT